MTRKRSQKQAEHAGTRVRMPRPFYALSDHHPGLGPTHLRGRAPLTEETVQAFIDALREGIVPGGDLIIADEAHDLSRVKRVQVLRERIEAHGDGTGIFLSHLDELCRLARR